MSYKVTDTLGYEGVLYKRVFSNPTEYPAMVLYATNRSDLHRISCRDATGFNFMISSAVGYCE